MSAERGANAQEISERISAPAFFFGHAVVRDAERVRITESGGRRRDLNLQGCTDVRTK